MRKTEIEQISKEITFAVLLQDARANGIERTKEKLERTYKGIRNGIFRDLYSWKPDYQKGYLESELICSQLTFYPSGKIYACWTTNQTTLDEILDSVWRERSEYEAREAGLSLEFRDDSVFLQRRRHFEKYSFPGMYPIYYVEIQGRHNQTILCPDCANDFSESIDFDSLADYDVIEDANYENISLYCDNCGERIESAYCEDEYEQSIKEGI